MGLGLSGKAVIRFLHQAGASISVSDTRTKSELGKDLEDIKGIPYRLEAGGHREETFINADLIIISPGVPYDIPVLQKARDRGVPILGEMEVAFQFLKVPILAVTGTNGKSTTSTLLHLMIQQEGLKSFLGGNIGRPLMELVLNGETVDYAVVEVSSFQLETTQSFHPKIATCLHFTPDHLDRHPSVEEYLRFKKRIFENMTRDDLLVLNGDDPVTRTFAEGSEIPRQFFFSEGSFQDGGRITPQGVTFVGSPTGGSLSFQEMKLKGAHNEENVAAAALMASAIGISLSSMQKVINTFPGLPHRMEFVRELKGVKFFNDSKGTNVGSTVKSLQSFSGPILLLAGGKDKGTDLSPLSKPIKERVRTLILYGEAKGRMGKELGSLTKTVVVNTLEEAVKESVKHASSGDVVLLSPACSSFDQFHDYKHRGDVFRQAVANLS